MKGFAKSPMGLTLDAVGQRYAKRPSSLLGMHPLDGRALLLDIAIAIAAHDASQDEKTVTGEYMRKQAKWPKHIKDELRGQGINVS